MSSFSATGISTDRKYLIITGSTAFNTSTIFIAKLQDGINDQLKDSMVEVFPATSGEYYEVTSYSCIQSKISG